jgi:hypothetical protein
MDGQLVFGIEVTLPKFCRPDNPFAQNMPSVNAGVSSKYRRWPSLKNEIVVLEVGAFAKLSRMRVRSHDAYEHVPSSSAAFHGVGDVLGPWRRRLFRVVGRSASNELVKGLLLLMVLLFDQRIGRLRIGNPKWWF